MQPWLRALLEIIDLITKVPVVSQYEKGGITDETLMYLGLGIDPLMLGTRAYFINKIVIEPYRNHGKHPDYVTSDELQTINTLGELIKLVHSKIS